MFVSFRNLPQLCNPLMIAIATYKNQRQRIIPHITRIRLKKHCLVMPTLFAVGILTPREGGIITYCRGDCVEHVSHFLFENVLVD
jgi:hypothetical protein